MPQRPLVLALSLVALAAASCSSFTAFVYGGRLEYGPRETNGKQTGLWTYWYDADHTKVRARGHFEDDKPVGRWEFFHANGARRFEVGFRADAYDGPSASWWPNGSPRAQGAFAAGLETGPWTFWDANGAKVAAGTFQNGLRDGGWTWFAPDGNARTQAVFVEGRTLESVVQSGTAATTGAAASSGGIVPSGGNASSSGSASSSGTASAGGSAQGGSATPGQAPSGAAGNSNPSSGTTSSAESTFAAVTQVVVPPPTPQVGVVAAPLSILQSGAADQDATIASTAGFSIEELTEIYATGKAPPSASTGYGADDPRNPPSQPKNDAEFAESFRGKPLPWTRLVQGDGSVLDLGDYRGRSNVMVVVLRGLKGRICEYCTAQMRALERRSEEFKRLGCEIVIVYPGSSERMDQFLGAAREFYQVHYGTEQPVSSCRITCDEDFQLVDGLGLKADLARPAVFLLDRQGIVRFPWVSKHEQDRPSCETLLAELKKLQSS